MLLNQRREGGAPTELDKWSNNARKVTSGWRTGVNPLSRHWERERWKSRGVAAGHAHNLISNKQHFSLKLHPACWVRRKENHFFSLFSAGGDTFIQRRADVGVSPGDRNPSWSLVESSLQERRLNKAFLEVRRTAWIQQLLKEDSLKISWLLQLAKLPCWTNFMLARHLSKFDPCFQQHSRCYPTPTSYLHRPCLHEHEQQRHTAEQLSLPNLCFG